MTRIPQNYMTKIENKKNILTPSASSENLLSPKILVGANQLKRQ
jgi:hypothetical protein